MHIYSVELVAPGAIFDSISLLLVPAKSWADAVWKGKRLAQIRDAREHVLAVRRMS